MIARSPRKAEQPAWLDELRAAYRDPLELLRDLGLSPAATGYAPGAAQRFAFRVPRPFAARMRHGDPHDPLLRQVLPLGDELREADGYAVDPVGDLAASPLPGLLHKYQGRALLLLAGACAVNCRYCFRREFPYQDAVGSPRLDAALAHIAADASLREIILSGGDPLILDDTRLAALVQALAKIPHVVRLRIHTRLPVVLPSRATPALCALLGDTRLRTVVVVHANHPREIDPDVAAALRAFGAAGIACLNQSVLLHGVNDDLDTLVALSESLFACGVLPYYLHLLDRVRGAAHFDVAPHTARSLQAGLQARLPGYLVPRVVQEVAGAPAKVPLV
ncbi:MAG: EF-P beta-lysylation protein EpmB [Gammaproteobacteria bacterium]